MNQGIHRRGKRSSCFAFVLNRDRRRRTAEGSDKQSKAMTNNRRRQRTTDGDGVQQVVTMNNIHVREVEAATQRRWRRHQALRASEMEATNQQLRLQWWRQQRRPVMEAAAAERQGKVVGARWEVVVCVRSLAEEEEEGCQFLIGHTASVPEAVGLVRKSCQGFLPQLVREHRQVEAIGRFRKSCQEFLPQLVRELRQSCSKCGLSRYKIKDCDKENIDEDKNPIWHANKRKCDGLLRYPVDSMQWKNIDKEFLAFENESRNLRVRLAIDEMNHYENLSTNHSSWPFLLGIYNLPLDVYLSAMIDDLKLLWDDMVEVFDGFANESF
ncbi:hypothetical protein V8G54_014667 [Vigna mungo]|uniref:Uncharacterized protein n=1 Tax=Vigna mungo TaxID=3915 RepID=A0AAQ3NI46_VIGMU